MDRIHVLNFNQITFRVQPDVVESFRKENLNISKVCLQKFHTGFITKSGDVLTCGHGRGGRLGHGSETMQLAPKGSSLNYFPFVKLMSVHVSFMEMFRPKKCSSWFLNVIIPRFVHWFQNCAQLNQSIRANIPGFSLAVCQLLESYQPMRKQDALDVMLRFNWRQFWNQWTKYRMMTLRNQLEHFFGLNTSRKDPCTVIYLS